ncbi:hypothetical protein L292_1590 [Acinetobacter junii CIP 107470 = MTCC 11364]|uniref:Uncharacterized protein n=2 Tax=Acinetobacter junii TaxID=40215 RepID=S7WBX1_ACIJU|nr:hypothetical protein [Acinetobacter junii]ENV52022.1 hypothetical protein F953_00512 [Acinetobacter junii CIP 107470 = MTCC 11364]EPR80476.1 hypothetical protein L292_1590 [Acinetobacter junii CIP 107470 = MTCC 11364]
MIQALLTGHKHQIDEFIISITQLGTDFQLSGVDDPRVKRFIKGNQVIMFGSHEATFPENESRIWTCQTDSYIDKSGLECVHLDGFSGAYFCKYLTLVKPHLI